MITQGRNNSIDRLAEINPLALSPLSSDIFQIRGNVVENIL